MTTADSVQYHLEKMLPELIDLEKRGIFNKIEIKSIVKKRTELEYAIHKSISKKSDFLKYIEFEMNLDRLRRKRKLRLGLNVKPEEGKKGFTLSDHSLVQRIHSLFKKCLRKFSGDIPLWVQYFDWCKTVSSSKALGDMYAKAIQLHPTKSLFWILAASWEFEENGNISSARILMQRALRINPENEKLWLEYFKLELLWIQKVKQRRQVLFLESTNESTNESMDTITPSPMDMNKDMNNESEEKEEPSVQVEELPQEKNLPSISTIKTPSNVSLALQELLIPRAVYKNAIKTIPNELQFRFEFISIYKQFPETLVGIQDVYSSIQDDLSDDPLAIHYLCGRFIFNMSVQDPQFPSQLATCIGAYESHLTSSPNNTELGKYYTEFLLELNNRVEEENLKLYLKCVLLQFYTTGDTNGCLTEGMYDQWHCISDENPQILQKALARFPSSGVLWKRILAQDPMNLDLYSRALTSLSGSDDAFPIWIEYLSLIQNVKEMEFVILEFEKLLLSSWLAKDLKIQILKMYCEYIYNQQGMSRVSSCLKRLESFYSTNFEFYELWLSFTNKEKSLVKESFRLYECMISTGEHVDSCFKSFIRFAAKNGDLSKASELCWRGEKLTGTRFVLQDLLS